MALATETVDKKDAAEMTNEEANAIRDQMLADIPEGFEPFHMEAPFSPTERFLVNFIAIHGIFKNKLNSVKMSDVALIEAAKYAALFTQYEVR